MWANHWNHQAKDCLLWGQCHAFSQGILLTAGGTVRWFTGAWIFFGGEMSKEKIISIFEKKLTEFLIFLQFQVYSSYRLVHAAHKSKKPIFAINIGPTRADKLIDRKLNCKISDVICNNQLS